MVPLNRLPKGNVLDEWYPLLPSSHAKVEIGSVRVKSKFTVRKVEVSWVPEVFSRVRRQSLVLADTSSAAI